MSLRELTYSLFSSILDVEPESDEDEEAILERRRQLRQAIVNKYRQSAPGTPQQPDSPAPPSEADSEMIGEKAAADAKEEEEEEKREMEGEQEGEEGGVASGLTKKDPEEEVRAQDELKKKKTNFAALRKEIRNGEDMFSEVYVFPEIQLVSARVLLWMFTEFSAVVLFRAHPLPSYQT